MSFTKGLVQGLASSIGLRASTPPSSPPLTLESSALMGPVTPDAEIASPWTAPDWLQTIVWGDVFGQSPDSPLTRAQAMGVPAIARARGVMTSTLGRLPLVVVDSEGADAKPLDGTDLGKFLAQPDPGQSRYIQVLWTVDDLIFHGVSWWLVTARYAGSAFQRGYPRAARRVLPGNVVFGDGGEVKVYGQPVDPADLIRIDGPHEGILNYAAGAVRTAARLEASAAKFADNPVPAVELHQTDDYVMSKTEKADLIGGWIAARKGANGGVAFTTKNIEAKMHGTPAEHLLTSGRNAAAIDAARVVGTPADTVDASVEHASMTYNTAESRLRVLLDFGLVAYGAAITARLSMPDVSPRGQFAAFAYDQITAVTDASVGTPAPAAAPTQETPPA